MNDFNNCAIVVAHPDDETLWAGGTIIMHPQAQWKIITLCRKSDPDRAHKFFRALRQLNATGKMGDLDDGPEQNPLPDEQVHKTILELLADDPRSGRGFDLIITHSPSGEYTRHLRHQETGRAVSTLWQTGRLIAKQIWSFAYEDGGGKYLPRPIKNADIKKKLPDDIWQKKYGIITEIYGFDPESFEARTTPREEAFWQSE